MARLVLLVAFLFSLLGCTPEQVRLFGLANAERATAGVGQLAPSPHAMVKAQQWADRLAASETLAHSGVSEPMPDGFLFIGENVGRGASIEAVHDGIMASELHRANLLWSVYSWIGVGHAVSASGRTYVVQVLVAY